MPKNIIDKIWDAHLIAQKENYPDILAIDLHLLHEVTSPQAFSELKERGIKVYDPLRCLATEDHNVSTAPDRLKFNENTAAGQIHKLRENCRETGIKIFSMGSGSQGIVHVMGPELGVTQPGMTIVCGDSHTATHGAFGALSFGIGTTEVSHVLAYSALLQKKPKTMKVEFKGKIPKGITAKDIILKLIREIGVGGANGHIIEYTGEVIENLSMEERMTICNMSIECGARSGMISPDEITYDYLKGRKAFNDGGKWEEYRTDEGATYDKEIMVDISGLSPLVTYGTNPAESVEILETIPESESLNYTKLEAGNKIAGTKIDYVFIGSCTNGRISDLRAAAEIFKGRKVNPEVICYVVPGSEQVKLQAEEEGLARIFTEAGCDFRNPGCSMCLAMNEDKVPEGKRCASTSNRNFVGRQGKGSITHLMSPIMAAAAAVTGEITDVRKLI